MAFSSIGVLAGVLTIWYRCIDYTWSLHYLHYGDAVGQILHCHWSDSSRGAYDGASRALYWHLGKKRRKTVIASNEFLLYIIIHEEQLVGHIAYHNYMKYTHCVTQQCRGVHILVSA